MGSWFEEGRGWRFDFRFRGQRYRAPRAYATKRESDEAEAALRRKLRRQADGLDVDDGPPLAPRFHEWAGVYLEYVRERARLGLIKRPDIIEGNLRVVLRFFGARPIEPDDPPPDYETPYYDLRLSDPINDPTWIRTFEDWLERRKVAAGTRNHYLNTLSALYKLAQHPEYRHAAPAITYNPFGFRPRARWRRRTAIVTPEQLQAWLRHASYHARLAMAIAALAPKLRLRNILELTWRDVDLERRVITVHDHKTDQDGEPLVAPISSALSTILVDARRRHPCAKRVVLYRGAPVKTIDGAVRAAAEAAGIRWGRDVRGGVTFHSLRHSMATLLARRKVAPVAHQLLMGHKDFETTLGYTHLEADDARPEAEELAAALNIAATVTSGPIRARRAKTSPARSPARQLRRSASR